MRKRAAPDWPIRLYRFWAKPIDSLPESLWDTARAMRELWNQLVVLRENLSSEAQRTNQAFSWEQFNKQATELVGKSALNWEAGPEVADRFRTAVRAAAKNQRSWPVSHARLDRISIPHRFTRGGVPVAKLFSERAKRFRLEPVEQWAYSGKTRRHTKARLTRGLFGIANGEAVRFKTVLHRELPRDALIKRVVWVGRSRPIRGWQWAIVIMVAEPPKPAARRMAARSCAINLGWRVMGNFVRVGVICDEAGRCHELRLPLDAPTSRSRRHGLHSGFYDLLAYDSEIGRLAENAKKRIEKFRELFSAAAPERVRPLLQELPKMRQAGLVNVIQILRDAEFAPEARQVLEQWLRENDRLKSLKLALSSRLIGRRRWLYQNLAAWLCRSYCRIVWETDFSIKAMIERRNQPPALRRAGRYHKWAATGELRRFIAAAASRYQTKIVPIKEPHSTIKCNVCGAIAAGDKSRLFLTCPAGHCWDQDVNAARNLLAEAKLRASGDAVSPPAGDPDIPAMLRDVVIPIGSP